MAAAHIYGSITEFAFEAESFTEWIERLEQWFIANDITLAAKKRALFLSNIGARGYKLVRSLSQNEPTGKTYKELKELMMEHLHPKPNEIAQRFIFFKRDRRAGESVKDYIAELRKLSEHCNFANNLQESLRDRFVCGLNDEKLQQKLLATKNLTLQSAVDTATAMEGAVRSAKQIHNNNNNRHMSTGVEGGIHKVGHHKGHFRGRGNQTQLNQGNQSSEMKECHRCGSTRHLGDTCPKKSSTCFKCKKVGHLSHKCKTIINGSQERNQKPGQGKIYYEGAEESHQDLLREDYELLEEGLNFVSLYRLDAVEAECNNDQGDDSEEQIEVEEGEQTTQNTFQDELNQYKKWIDNVLTQYWESKESDTENEDDLYESDEYYEEREEEQEIEIEVENDGTAKIEEQHGEKQAKVIRDEYDEVVELEKELEDVDMQMVNDNLAIKVNTSGMEAEKVEAIRVNVDNEMRLVLEDKAHINIAEHNEVSMTDEEYIKTVEEFELAEQQDHPTEGHKKSKRRRQKIKSPQHL